MAIHSSILAWRIPWTDRAWWATVHKVCKESKTTEKTQHARSCYFFSIVDGNLSGFQCFTIMNRTGRKIMISCPQKHMCKIVSRVYTKQWDCQLIKYAHVKYMGSGLAIKSCPALATAWTVALQTPLPWNFPSKYWSGFPFLSLGDHLDPEIELGSPALQANSLPTDPPSIVTIIWLSFFNLLMFENILINFMLLN